MLKCADNVDFPPHMKYRSLQFFFLLFTEKPNNRGYVRICDMLILHGADADALTMCASYLSYCLIFREISLHLLTWMISPWCPRSQETALHRAAAKGHTAVVCLDFYSCMNPLCRRSFSTLHPLISHHKYFLSMPGAPGLLAAGSRSARAGQKQLWSHSTACSRRLQPPGGRSHLYV